MKTEKITKTVEIEKEVYIADDGATFEKGSDCIQYEAKITIQKYTPTFNVIQKRNIDFVNGDSSYDYSWYKVMSQADCETVIQYYKADTAGYIEDYSWFEIPKFDQFPQWIGIRTDDNGDLTYVGTLEDYRKEVNEFFTNFEE